MTAIGSVRMECLLALLCGLMCVCPQELAMSGEGKVFVTDAVVSHLMAGAKATNPWYTQDLVLKSTSES